MNAEMGDTLPYVDLGNYTYDISSVQVSENHFCVVTASDANVICWGDNSYGQLGLGHTDTIGAEGRLGAPACFFSIYVCWTLYTEP
jgi:hypothetical protein